MPEKVNELNPNLTFSDVPRFLTTELLARIMKKALRKGSNTSDDDSQIMGVNGDETDTEQHDSLPRDHESTRPSLARQKGNRHRNSIEAPHLEGVPERKTSLKNIVKMVTQKRCEKTERRRYNCRKDKENFQPNQRRTHFKKDEPHSKCQQ